MTQQKDLVDAFEAFIVGCKADGIWNAIKACCVLAAWDGINGALIPLKGAAPTNFNFVNGDYDRTTGLIGDGSTKYLDSNRNNNADPQNSQHLAVWITAVPSDTTRRPFIGCGVGDTGSSQLNAVSGLIETRSRNSSAFTSLSVTTGFAGFSRYDANEYVVRNGGAEEIRVNASQTPLNENINVFRRNASNSSVTNARLSYYSIGESLDLAKLDARVSTLMTAIGAAV